ncbi:hypothetical protein [Mesorhizobium sp.]|uniref:hypothetical protein n=1 Tax=Mesorhizobium sp. TaxID=1871066 RepID=UPI0025CBE50E|nr:hypothetical protein [Mesorhizobium sp.]
MPTVDRRLDGHSGLIVAGEKQVGGKWRQLLQPVDLPNIFHIATAAAVAKIDIESMAFGTRPKPAGYRIKAPKLGRKQPIAVARRPCPPKCGKLALKRFLRRRRYGLPLCRRRSQRSFAPPKQHRMQRGRSITLPAVVAAARNDPSTLLAQPVQHLGRLHAAQPVDVPADSHTRSAKVSILIYHAVEKPRDGNHLFRSCG